MNDFRLYHHGILGQKWGKKNGPPYPLDNQKVKRIKREAREEKDKKKKVNPDYAKAHAKRNVKEMSDKELREVLNRLNMEQQYERMNPTVINNGRKTAAKFLKDSATVIGVIAVGKKTAPYVIKGGKLVAKGGKLVANALKNK